MTDSIKKKWNKIYAKSDHTVDIAPCEVLSRYNYLLPQSGNALDLACGLGGNALFLTSRSLDATAIDSSSEAIDKLNAKNQPRLTCECLFVSSGEQLGESIYDVIVVSRFLDRSLCGAIVRALKPGGVLFYQTFVSDKADTDVGPSNPDYLLQSNELLRLFADLHILAFNDEATVGDVTLGVRNQSYLVGQRRS